MPTLDLSTPPIVRYGDRAHRCQKGVSYRVLRAVLAHRGRNVPGFVRAVWGCAAGEVKGGAVRQAIWRANRVLNGVGCPLRLGLEAGRVVVV